MKLDQLQKKSQRNKKRLISNAVDQIKDKKDFKWLYELFVEFIEHRNSMHIEKCVADSITFLL